MTAPRTAEIRHRLHVIFTMDCDRPKDRSDVPGPGSWDAAQDAMMSFALALKEERLVGTFFLVPQVMKGLHQAVRSLKEGGMELGLLCHPQLLGYQSFLGAYGYETQREVVELCRTQWEDAWGEAARCFRPGFFSCNDYTFQILCIEGFRQGSCSMPARVDQDQFCIWHKSYPFPHHADPLDRRVKGTMEFYEVPITSDYEAIEYPIAETFTPAHLRLEDPYMHEHARGLMEKHLSRMEEEGVRTKAICFVTTNSVRWGSDDDPHIGRLQNLVRMLKRMAESRRLRLAPATIESLHRDADLVWRDEHVVTADEDE